MSKGDASSGSQPKAAEQAGAEPPEHHLCILVPFRDRWEELLVFVPHMKHFLADQQVSHEIWILNQADELRFRAFIFLKISITLSFCKIPVPAQAVL